ncbi:MAG: DinB family protein [Pyrinomonadaceae bacterium]
MSHHSVAEIYAFMDEARRRLEQRVVNLTPTQQRFKTSADAWCIGEVTEHLALIEERLSRTIAAAVKRASVAEGYHRASFAPVSLDRFAEQAARKLEAPEMVRPGGLASISDSLAKMRDSRATLAGLRPQVEVRDFSAVIFPHPLFGPLNIYEWLVTIGLHEERHLKQIENIIAAPDFPS